MKDTLNDLSDVHDSSRVGDNDSPAMWSHPDATKPIIQAWNNTIKRGNHDGSKFGTHKFINIGTVMCIVPKPYLWHPLVPWVQRTYTVLSYPLTSYRHQGQEVLHLIRYVNVLLHEVAASIVEVNLMQ